MINITSPYPYQELKRKSVDGKRLYENPWGEAVPSVTTILDKTKPYEKRVALQKWKERVGEAEAQRITSEAADNGTRMHAILEYWVKNQEYTGETTILSQKMADIIISNIEDDLDEVWGSEVNLCAPGLYAGTTDLVGVYKGKPCIMDFKQTNKPKRREWIDDYFLQGVAYALAHNELYGTDIKNIAIFMCSRECEWQLFEVDELEFDRWSLNWAIRLEQFYGLTA
jgi:ATP-dependent exoDNAse (exonuclease V) beta subunit